jgi:cold shock CspA family protein
LAVSPVVQATQDAVASLHKAVALWGKVFEGAGAASRSQLESDAEALSAVFASFGIAYGALPRFRTEPALRRFTESLQTLERSVRALHMPSASEALDEVGSAVADAAQHAETAFTTLSGKPAEPREQSRPVQGTVSKLMSDRGYGFVKQSGATSEVFFTAQALKGVRFTELRVGQNVSFRIVPDPRVPGRMQAIELQSLRAG